MVGALLYLAMTRPGTTYFVHAISQYMHAPHATHVLAVKHIFRYLQGAIDHGLIPCPSADASIIVAYSDVDWVGCNCTCHMTTIYAIYF